MCIYIYLCTYIIFPHCSLNHRNSFSSHHSQGPKQRPHAAPCRGHHQCGRSGNEWSQRRRAVQRPQGGCGRRDFLGVTTRQSFTTFLLAKLWYIIGIIFQILFNYWQLESFSAYWIFHIFHIFQYLLYGSWLFLFSPPFNHFQISGGPAPERPTPFRRWLRWVQSWESTWEQVGTWEFPKKIIFQSIIFQVFMLIFRVCTRFFLFQRF